MIESVSFDRQRDPVFKSGGFVDIIHHLVDEFWIQDLFEVVDSNCVIVQRDVC